MFRLLQRRLRPPRGPDPAPVPAPAPAPARSLSRRTPELPAARIRTTFLDFFRVEHEHRFVPSSPVRPRGDPSLLFVNAGMNQFKPLLLGTVDPRSDMASYRRVVNSQRCVRAGGKHNDLEDVGRDGSHHTCFEMLGSWSFGDYFKEEACSMAWSLLTEHYGIPADRLYVSYFAGDAASGLPPDHETQRIWLDIGVPPRRLLPFGLKENFWEMGECGPCGPCTEIHYDHVGGGRDAAALVNADHPDVVELWNLVFMQYNREADRRLQLLPHFSVDTGMGLERLVSVLQGHRSNYDTDLFTPLMDAIAQRAGVAAYGGKMGPAAHVDTAYRVVADHMRALTVCIADGVHPGMTGAELVLRRILRRAVRFCSDVLQAPQGTLASLVPTVIDSLGHAYPELRQEEERIVDVINENEAQFLSSLQRGGQLILRTLRGMEQQQQQLFPASVAWSLHRDLGFPLDLVDLILEERGVKVDRQELERLAAHNQQLSSEQGAGPESWEPLDLLSLAELRRLGVPHTDDQPKYQYRLDRDQYVFPECRATVVALHDGRTLVSKVEEGQRCGVILDRTCFYAEQGGQSHDRGYLTRDGLQDTPFSVEAVGVAGGYVVHRVTAAGQLQTGDAVTLHLDQSHRFSCMVNHTSTHLLSLALRSVLGDAVQQRGSHVSADHLRFDFNCKGSLSASQLQQVEGCVADVVSANQEVHMQEVPLRSAMSIVGLRTVDEVYPDPVRVVSVGTPVCQLLDAATHAHARTSVELCCGTHLLRTGAVRDLVIVSERQLVKGISRVVALTGAAASRAREAGEQLLAEVDSLASRVSGSAPLRLDAAQRLAKETGLLSDAVDNTPVPQWLRRELQQRLKALQRSSNTSVRKLELQEAAVRAQALLEASGGKRLLVVAVETDSESVLMKMVNQLSAASPQSHVMLFAPQKHSGKIFCACQVPKDTPLLSASDWATAVCGQLGGAAGGSALVARGTGNSSDVTEALRFAEEFVRHKSDATASPAKKGTQAQEVFPS